jgi:hypothetical protein
VHGAKGLVIAGLVPEERACMGECFKDALVIEEFVLVGIDRDRRLFPGIIIVDQETIIPVPFPDYMDVPERTAAFPALEALKGQSTLPP